MTMEKKYDLCGACAEMLKEGYTLKKISGGVDNKVTCSNCGRRRYGGTYQMEKKETKK